MKKIKEKLAAGFLGLACMLFVLAAPGMSLYTYASAGKMILGLSASSLTLGEEVTVTVTAYDTEGTSTTASMRIVYDSSLLEYTGSDAQSASGSGGEVTATGNSIKFRFQAIGEGRASVVAYGTTEAGELTAGGVRISVATASQTPEEPDEPQQPEETPSNGDETGDDTDTGEVQPVSTPQFEIEGVTYEVSSDFGAELVNKGFEPVEVQVQSATVTGLQYPETDWTVLFLVSTRDDTVNGYYLYDEQTGTVCPYLGYGLGGVQEDNSGDLTALQEKNDTLSDRYEALKTTNRRMMIGMIVAAVAIVLILINVLIFRGINRREEEPEEDEDDLYDERDVIEKQGAYLEATASNSEHREEDRREDIRQETTGRKEVRQEEPEVDFAAEVAAILNEDKSRNREISRDREATQSKEWQKSNEFIKKTDTTDTATTDDDSLEIIDLEDL